MLIRGLRQRQTRREAGAQNLRASLSREVAGLLNSGGASYNAPPLEKGYRGIRSTVLLLASMALVVLLGCVAIGSEPTLSQESPAKPNFVFILADDMREADLQYMPKTRALLGAQGMRFKEAFVSLSLCCASRATIMR